MPPALIHTCYRIGDIDRSVAFYEALGFEELKRMPIRDEAINVFMGLPGDGARLELTYNHGVDSYELGTGYNHIAITTDDMDGTLRQIGIGDYVVSKHVGRMMGALGGRLGAFRAADAGGTGYAEAVRRNIFHEAPPSDGAVAAVSARLERFAGALGETGKDDLLAGRLPAL